MPALLRRAFTGAALAWAVLLVAVPFIASRSHATPFGTAIVVAVYGIGSFVCHQLPERSYWLWSAQMPVCARCAGIYAGGAAAALIGGARAFQASDASRPRRRSPARLRAGGASARPPQLAQRCREQRRKRPALHARVTLALAALPSAATLVYEWTTGVTPSNALRFAAGIPIGVVVAWLVVSAAENQVN